MQLGPIQTQWVANLKAHPERQMKDFLGQGSPREYKACCLGELFLCEYRAKKKKLPFINGQICSGEEEEEESLTVIENYKDLGLYSSAGNIREDARPDYPGNCLALLNDSYYTWPEIAAFVEANPDHFFTKSI